MIQLAIILILAVSICFLTVFVLKSIFQPKKLDSIAKLIKQQRFVAAERAAKSLIAKNPRDYMAHYYLGKAYLADKKNELALMEFKLVNQNAIFDGHIPEVDFRKQISQLFIKFNQTDDALRECLLLTKLDPMNAENYYTCGKLYEQKGKSEQSIGFYQKAIQRNRKHVKAHAAYALALFRMKNVTEARKEIDLAIALSPETFSSYYYLGKILKEQKDYSGAVKAFEKALRDPEYKQKSLLERGSCYMMANSMDNAINEFDKAVRASKNDSSQETLYARYFLAACYEKGRNIDKAIEQWQIIYKHNHSFRDVGAKLSEYKDVQTNDSLKEYLTCSSAAFPELCKKAALEGMGMLAQKIDTMKWGIRLMATEQKKDDWMNVRKQLYLIDFHRDTEPIEDTEIRTVLDTAKSHNCAKAFVCTSSGFTSSATGFAENRPIELIGKERLEAILAKAGI
jgi:tetratricopeptide (TPR) repeat protein